MKLKDVNYHLEKQMFSTQYNWLKHIVEVKHQSYTQSAYDKIRKKIVHVKCVFNQQDKSINEIRHLKKLYFNPYCIEMHNFFFITKHVVYIVLESFDYTLHSFLKQNGCLSEQNTHTILKQIAKAIYFLSKYNILHLKLTDSNIIICPQTLKIKIKNLNAACKINKNFLYKKKIKTLFAPPEWYLKKNCC